MDFEVTLAEVLNPALYSPVSVESFGETIPANLPLVLVRHNKVNNTSAISASGYFEKIDTSNYGMPNFSIRKVASQDGGAGLSYPRHYFDPQSPLDIYLQLYVSNKIKDSAKTLKYANIAMRNNESVFPPYMNANKDMQENINRFFGGRGRRRRTKRRAMNKRRRHTRRRKMSIRRRK